MAVHGKIAVADVGNNLAAARTMAWRIVFIYVVLVGIWILIQSGIPIAPFVGIQIEPLTWKQTLAGWFFVASTGWLLYLLLERGLALIEDAQQALRLRDRAIESSVNAILITDCRQPDQPIVYVNPAFERITGYTRKESIGRNPRFLHGPDVDQPELEAVRLAVKEQRECQVLLRNYRKDGTMFWNELAVAPVKDDIGEVTHYVGVQNDISEMRRYQDELARQSNFDSLTGLANRNLLADRVRVALARADRYSNGIAIAVIDLDHFKLVNDSLGHVVGDQLLKLVAERLKSCMRAVDTVARIGGDEFVLVLVDQGSEQVVSSEVYRIVETFGKPYVVGDQELFVTGSVGVAFSPRDGVEIGPLLKNAESAMYRAKESGRNNLQFYTEAMNAIVSERLALTNKLRRAVERNELFLHYQPLVDVQSNQFFGTEALVRWRHPELGIVSPAKFIPLAEETGMIVAIGEWVLRTACMQNKAWQDAGLPRIAVAVNISARQFREKGLVQTIERILEESGLDSRYLELEVTEGVIMHDIEQVIAILQQIKSLGVKLSIDDFGTGYSSLSYLKRFPVDRLKIDQSFVRDITSDPDDAAIAQAVINLGHSLDLKVIAEGVETQEQLDFLRDHGCDEKQGYLISRPVPAEDFARLLMTARAVAELPEP